MIGILCNKRREEAIVRRLHALFRPLIRDYDMPVVVFTIQGLDLQQKMVTGWMISCNSPSEVKTKLPGMIFNLAIQSSRTEIKTIRGLMEIEGVLLVNITNRYNQWSILEMLSSDNGLKKYVLPYIALNDKNYSEGFQDNENFIVKPLKGTNLSKIIYGNRSDSGFRRYDRSTKEYLDRVDFEDTIFSAMKTKRVLLLKTPELLTNNSQLCITRVFAQRNSNGDWEALSRVSIPQNECICDGTDNMLNKASIQIISYINRFIPDMFFSFVDFVTDMKGMPYILNFGGWDNRILRKTQNRDIHAKICKNMLKYAQALLNIPIEGGNYVD